MWCSNDWDISLFMGITGAAPSKYTILHVNGYMIETGIQDLSVRGDGKGHGHGETLHNGRRDRKLLRERKRKGLGKTKEVGKKRRVRSQVFYRNERKATGLFFLYLCFLVLTLHTKFCAQGRLQGWSLCPRQSQ